MDFGNQSRGGWNTEGALLTSRKFSVEFVVKEILRKEQKKEVEDNVRRVRERDGKRPSIDEGEDTRLSYNVKSYYI